ncbi:protein disulfide-isomerase a6 [Anaeramoeba flamelloides]|uniref:Protein disulfide-isomerase a6 n=1 Tax=Anaeramoeba flamelloides TaxID=1746091 RepID=A0AAV8A1U5_9EUKA|nr:protein disulfide-isomerase a6 [Anaeramoeba flamelloides]
MRKYDIKGFLTMKIFAPVSKNSPNTEKKVIPFERQSTINSISQFVLSYLPNYVDGVEQEDCPVAEQLAEKFGIEVFPKLLLIVEDSTQLIELFDQKLSLQSIHTFLQKYVTNDQKDEEEANEENIFNKNENNETNKQKEQEKIVYINEIGFEKYEELCTGAVRGFCVVGLFDKDDQESIHIYEKIAIKFYKDKLFTFSFLNEEKENEKIKNQIREMTGKDKIDYKIIVIRPKRSRWTIFDGVFANEIQLQTFFEKITTGDIRFKNSQIKDEKIQNDKENVKEL